MTTANSSQVPVNVSGSSVFGIYPKISLEKSYNFFISDNWLVNYAGYQLVVDITTSGKGRALFRSVRGGFLVAVIGTAVYNINNALAARFIGNISTLSGEVVIDENLNQQICIVDGQNAYIYDYADTGVLTLQTLLQADNTTPIIPNYVTYHNTFFLIASSPNSINPQQWYAFVPGMNEQTISLNSTFSLQTKPDNAIAVKRLPGRGNNILVIGETVSEVWNQVGGAANYQRVSSYNIDYGAVAVATIAANEEQVCWLAQNENNAPIILISNGSETSHISTDGIDTLLGTIKYPDQSTAFFYRQDGHLFYHIVFYNVVDNLSLIYDFSTQKFFHVSDENLNYYPAREVVYFNENTYFVSINDGNIYSMGAQYTTYNYNINPNVLGQVIPRIRICKTIRKEDSSIFRVGMFTFWIEQGLDDTYVIANNTVECTGLIISEIGVQIVSESGYALLAEYGECVVNNMVPCVDMSISKNGNQSFSNVVRRELNSLGNYRNQIRWWRMGQANEFTIQLRFYGFSRMVAFNGMAEVY